MKQFKSALLLITLLFSISLFAAPVKEAEELLTLMKLEKTLTQSMDQMLQIQLQQNPALLPYKATMMKFLNKYMSYDRLKPELVKIYAESYTKKELNDLIAFYKTDTGKKSIDLMPALTAQGAQLGATLVQQNLPELQQMIQEEATRIQGLQQQ